MKQPWVVITFPDGDGRSVDTTILGSFRSLRRAKAAGQRNATELGSVGSLEWKQHRDEESWTADDLAADVPGFLLIARPPFTI